MTQQNYTLLCDFYEFTMANGYFEKGIGDKTTYFDVFFRRAPDNAGFAIAAGLEQVIQYINNLSFTEDDIAFLSAKGLFSDKFLAYLKDFSFTGDIYAVPEGTPIFPNEPILTVKATAIQAQLIETFILLALNHQSLIATKANRIVRAANGRRVLEMGTRRAQGSDGAIMGSRAAYIGGCDATSCTISDKYFGVPSVGTMAHSWVQMFEDEYTAFKTYCKLYPNNTTLLVDTYNVLKSGIPNAIKAFKEILIPQGITEFAVRLDSGDIAYLSRKARKMLDKEGLTNCKIVATNSLDEHLIRDIIIQGGEIDIFGVGERLITSKSNPVFGGVYKLSAIEDESGNITPKIKISENVSKITNPHYKKLYRIFSNETEMAIADLICVHDEVIDQTKPIKLFDPNYIWKTTKVTDYKIIELQVPIFIKGKQVYTSPPLAEIREYAKTQIGLLWEEVRRFENPHTYYVDLSKKLWTVKQELLNAANEGETE